MGAHHLHVILNQLWCDMEVLSFTQAVF